MAPVLSGRMPWQSRLFPMNVSIPRPLARAAFIITTRLYITTNHKTGNESNQASAGLLFIAVRVRLVQIQGWILRGRQSDARTGHAPNFSVHSSAFGGRFAPALVFPCAHIPRHQKATAVHCVLPSPLLTPFFHCTVAEMEEKLVLLLAPAAAQLAVIPPASCPLRRPLCLISFDTLANMPNHSFVFAKGFRRTRGKKKNKRQNEDFCLMGCPLTPCHMKKGVTDILALVDPRHYCFKCVGVLHPQKNMAGKHTYPE